MLRTMHTTITNIGVTEYHLWYTRNNINLYPHKAEDRNKIISQLDSLGQQYYTYTTRDEKTHAFVVRGLDLDPTPEELQLELERKGLQIFKVYKMSSSRTPTTHPTNPRPLYMVVTPATCRLNNIAAKTKYVLYTQVTWERHTNKKGIIQCHRCQRWGHATANCRMTLWCLKCAGAHATNRCSKSRETPAECTNCGAKGDKGYPANSTECPVYRYRLASRMEQKPAPATRSPPAAPQYTPPPPSSRQRVGGKGRRAPKPPYRYSTDGGE